MTTSPTTPKLRRLRFHVWLAPEGVDPEACTDEQATYASALITHQDQLKGELMAAQRHVDIKAQPMALTSLWLYCSLARSGEVTDRYETFRVRLLSYDPADRDVLDQLDDDEDHEDDANPTEASTSSD